MVFLESLVHIENHLVFQNPICLYCSYVSSQQEANSMAVSLSKDKGVRIKGASLRKGIVQYMQ